ncbi:alpha-protein kinase 1 [Drosophila grimshawi]|uniref:alpha-protein kinase 1 n=1 Tax=Drosophila grimshawi TaxID=7222 RepID=UPI001C93591F|nr:alpha-protein kinase 1 [Drosophila grimshawi]
MEHKRKPNYSKPSYSIFTRREAPAPSTSNRERLNNTNAYRAEISKQLPNNPNGSRPKGIRGFFKQTFLNAIRPQYAPYNQQPDQIQNTFNVPLEEGDVRRLIGLYAEYEILYNPNHPQYGNKHIEKIYYSDIARSFPNRNGAQIQANLLELRTQFESEYAIIHNGQHSNGGILTPSIPYYNEFLFLVPFLDNRLDRDLAGGTSEAPPVNDSSAKRVNQLSGKNYSNLISNTLVLPTPNCFPHRKKKDLKRERSDTISAGKEKGPATDTKIIRSVQINEEPIQQVSLQQEKQQAEYKIEPEQKVSWILAQKLEQQAKDAKQPQQQVSLEQYPEQQAKEQIQLQVPLEQEQEQQQAQNTRQKNPPLSEQQHQQQLVNQQEKYQEGLHQKQCSQSVLKGAQIQLGAKNNANEHPVNFGPNLLQPRIAIIHVGPRAAQGFNQGPATAVKSQKATQDPRGDREASTQPGTDSNQRQQVQVLCDMIRAELGSAPDFIYYDAKWRIIEILREVNRRQMDHRKCAATQSTNKEPNGFALEEESELARQLKASQCSYCPKCCKR